MPAFRDRASRTDVFTRWDVDSTEIQFSRALGKLSAGSAIALPGPQALIDTVPGDTTTTFTLTVDAAPIISAVDTIADEDFYSITLIAGHQYQIGLYAYTPQGPGDPAGPNGVPLSDAYLELYDSAGNLITSADGGSDTVFNTANSGFDALLTFTASTTGTYYVNARAYDNTPLDGSDNGDVTGDYGLYAEDVTGDESLYTPYYSPSSPLYAIDWGTQVNKVNQSVRNPDGNEGTRNTGNADGNPTYTSLIDIPALAAAQGKNITDKNVITIYFAKAGDVFVSNDPANPGLPPATITAVAPKDFERLAVFTSLSEFEKVADVIYLEVQDRNHADFVYTSYQGTPGPGVSLLGSMSPPDESDEGLAQFNSGDSRWNATDLQQGGFSFVTLIHEFGHGHGLAHPHDNGGHSGIMNGVEPEGAGVADYTTGDDDLNQGVFTMMSYEDGWQTSPHTPRNAPTTGGYGYMGGLMAFDIAAIQDKYGVNEDYNLGNNTYTMKDVNAPGTYYYSIWDGGGIDEIVYGGARNSTIDLRAATLEYAYGGGGNVSYALGIYGGFTIANGVTIENAIAGSGNDVLVGNHVANALVGGAGVDMMYGLLGDDTYYVDNTGDIVNEAVGAGTDRVATSASYALAAGSEVERLEAITLTDTTALNLTGNAFNNTIIGNNGANVLMSGGGNDVLLGAAGNDALVSGAAGSTMYGGTGNDTFYVSDSADATIEGVGEGADRVATSVSYTLAAGQEVEALEAITFSATNALDLTGNSFVNSVYGNNGANVLDGKGGGDTLAGLGGADTFAFTTALGAGNVDSILDFQTGTDKISLDDAIFTGLAPGPLSAGAFATGSGAGEADDRIIYNSATGALLFDADGNGAGAAVQFAQLSTGLSLSASDFSVI